MVGNMSSIVCQTTHNITSKGLWKHDNPLDFSTPLLLLQVSVISLVSKLFELCLRPLGQSQIVSQIFGGMVLGPSLLGQQRTISSKLFPPKGTTMIEIFSTFGIMFFFFSTGVKMDLMMMIRPGRKALAVSISAFFFTLTLPNVIGFILKKCLSMDAGLSHSLPFIASSQSITAFPVIACLLTELKLINTDLGRLAVTSAMFCDFMGITLTAVVFSMTESKGDSVLTTVWSVLSYIALLAFVATAIRPAVLWMLNHLPDGQTVDEMRIFAIFVLVLVAGFVSETIGQHYILGPLVVGLAIPDGPPLGAAIVSRLDSLVIGLIYPTFLAVSGLKTNIFEIHLRALWVVGIVVVFACLVKIGAVILPAMYTGLSTREALVLGLVLNAKGINELVIYNLWLQGKLLENSEFTIVVISVLVVTAIITPLIRILYDPSKQYVSIKRTSIQQAKCNTEFRIMVCIQNQESVPTIINILEVSYATEESPVAVIALHLVQLVGRTTPMLVAHQPERTLDKKLSLSRSNHLINALRHYEQHNEGAVSIQSFTSMSHFETIHDDICRVARDEKATIVIVPFHKQWAIDGSVGMVNRPIQNVNLNVLDKAPCSVGILVDRGILSGSLSVLNGRSIYHVAVIFIGGGDDVESLAYGTRMSRHGSVNLTVIRFLLFGSENTRERKRDTDLIDEFRQAIGNNGGFLYKEEVVRDGVGLATLLRGLEDCFDLVIVGRHHPESPLLSGLDQWSECQELGVIGDMLASPDFGSTASVLVIQQQRLKGGNIISTTPTRLKQQPILDDRDPFLHDDVRNVEGARDQNASWTISINRY